MSTSKNHLLLIFLKEPIPGKVKTRLAATLGEENAVLIYRALVSVLLTQLKWMPDTHYRFCFAPADGLEAIQHWILPHLEHRLTPDGEVLPLSEALPSVDFTPQSEGDLGQRLEAGFKQGFNEGFREVSAIGTDCPYLSARWVQTARLTGRNSDTTIGPTFDGGYCYLSMKSFSSAPFTDIPWSTEETFPSTLKALKKAQLTHTILPKLNDIDHEEDWNEALTSMLGGKLRKALKRA